MWAPSNVGRACVALASLLSAFPQGAEGIEAKLKTPWTDDVNSDPNPLGDYPRPQMVRSDWQSLNGEWDYMGGNSTADPTTADAAPDFPSDGDKIKVPFPPESYLSGILKDLEMNMWYRRDFSVPSEWSDDKVMLNFEAVAQTAVVFVNGKLAGRHAGRWEAFSIDVTDMLQDGGNTVIVGANDPHNGAWSCGKNVLGLGDYTFTSGIWQTVWLEPVPAANVRQLKITPNVDNSEVSVTVDADGAIADAKVTISSEGSEVGSATGKNGTEIVISVDNPHLWSPDDPFLYDVEVQLLDDSGKVVDKVTSYFGMRSIKLGKASDGKLHPIFNGEFLFQLGPLDQGYWPDGIHTPPSEDAIKSELSAMKDIGFNMIRKHAKVEPQRWYHWADKLGLLIWQDMPSIWWPNNTEITTQFENEWQTIIDQHHNSPSIITWVPFNENWGAYDVARITDWTKNYDPSRMVDGNSGYNNAPPYRPAPGDPGNGDYDDLHEYPGPGDPPQPSETRAAALGEFGGIGLLVDGHMWPGVDHNAYEMQNSTAELTTRFAGLQGDLAPLIQDKGLGVAVYTQVTDVEHEVNGIFTYDRQVKKVEFDQARTAIQDAISKGNDLHSSKRRQVRNW